MFILYAAPESRQWFSVIQTGTRLINFLSLLALSGNCSLICRRAVNTVAHTVCSHSICLPSILLWQPSCTIRLLNLQLAQCAPFDNEPNALRLSVFYCISILICRHMAQCCVWHNEVAGSRQKAGLPGLAVGNKNWHSS